MFQAVDDVYEPEWGPSYGSPTGAIAVSGQSAYAHRFGGNRWRVEDPNPIAQGPALLFAFDLRDPLLAALRILPCDELPLCSYISTDIWAYPQLYRIDQGARRITLLERKEPGTEEGFPEWGQPFREKPMSLTPMVESDCPTTEDAYWRICDEFLGGGRFIRVLGPPLWLYAPATVTCQCGKAMQYVCGLGHESDKCNSGLLEQEPIFFGEGGIYWFVCADCLMLGVISQPT